MEFNRLPPLWLAAFLVLLVFILLGWWKLFELIFR